MNPQRIFTHLCSSPQLCSLSDHCFVGFTVCDGNVYIQSRQSQLSRIQEPGPFSVELNGCNLKEIVQYLNICRLSLQSHEVISEELFWPVNDLWHLHDNVLNIRTLIFMSACTHDCFEMPELSIIALPADFSLYNQLSTSCQAVISLWCYVLNLDCTLRQWASNVIGICLKPMSHQWHWLPRQANSSDWEYIPSLCISQSS